jgi:hypothetical protein
MAKWGIGTEDRYRRSGGLEGKVIELDLAANAASLGAPGPFAPRLDRTL